MSFAFPAVLREHAVVKAKLLLANVEVLYAVCKRTALKKYFSETDSLSALADTMKNFFTEQSCKALMFPAKYFYRGYDKQFGADGTSLFILRVCFLANVEVLYAVCKQTALKNIFRKLIRYPL